MNKKVIIGIIAAIGIILLSVWAYIMAQPTTHTTPTTTPSTNQQYGSTDKQNTQVPATTVAATITYTDKGFTPSTTTVKKGAVITVKNSSSSDLQFSSGDHPTHRLDPELNMNVLKPGESGNITVSTVGSHSYHNHLDAGMQGTIVVTE
jgi:plastocyanin